MGSSLVALRSSRYALSVQLRAQLRLRRLGLAEDAGDDLVAVEAAILDEHLVRVEARDDDAGDEQVWDTRLEGVRVVFGNARRWIDRDAGIAQQLGVRCE